MKYKAVLLDMDGTVLDTIGDLTDSVNETLRRFNMPPVTEAEAMARLGNGSKWLLNKCAPEGTSQEILDKMLEFYLPYYNCHSHIKTAPYAGIISMMERLRTRGVRLAVVSNKPDTTVKALSENIFHGLVEAAVGEMESAGIKRKPNPAMVLEAVKSLKLEAEDCVYVGDTEVDLKTAANAGMDCISVLWGFRSREQLEAAGACKFAESPEALYEMIV